ncbi:MAG: isopentenyl-diphosphate Delta-isomerase [Spirochaetes bacterium]|nr:isopentenyl-diphosphate Delta-isomerase [Spirochaetota bacterium]
MISMEQVIIVNEDDNEIEVLEKIEAHVSGKLHRAFSLFVFNSNGKLLIHKRADDKYHSGGLWTNTCCGHQRPDESLEMSIHRRLKEEMGFDCELKKLFTIQYQAEMNNSIIENEIDHVFSGIHDQDPSPDPLEVSDYSWVDPKDLIIETRDNPEKYSHWFKLLLERVINNYYNYL